MFEVVFEADNGKTFIFGPSGSNWFGMNIGDGMEVTLGTSQGFSQIGEKVENQSVGGRPIDVTGQIYGDVVTVKNALRNTCAPLTSGRLVFQKTHYIRVYVKAAPTFSAVKNNGLFKMQFYAPFPFYRSLDEEMYYVGAVEANFSFPVNYGTAHRFGTRASAKYITVNNTGDVKIPFKVYLRSNGTCTNITITNMTTFAFLRINGTLNAGDVVEVYRDDDNVLRAELTSNEEVTDIISWVDEESSLFELDVGDNIITATDDGGGTSLTAQFTFSPAVVALYES